MKLEAAVPAPSAFGEGGWALAVQAAYLERN